MYTWFLATRAQCCKWLQIVWLAASLTTLSGCAKKVLCIRTEISPTANQTQPVAVDVLFVRDKDLIKKLMAMPASDWFQSRAQFLRDYPDPKELTVYHREWVPGQVIPCSAIVPRPDPRATFVFANYFSKGDHRARLKNRQSVAIHLLDDDLEVVPVKECSRSTCSTTP